VVEPSTGRLFAILAFLGLCGAVVLIVATRWGAGLSPDSIIYIAAARNLLRGYGLSVSFDPQIFSPLNQYPPLYPALLAGIGYFGLEPLVGARWLNAILFALNIGMAGLLAYLTVRSFWGAAFASLFMMAAPPMVLIHSMAWSEPLYLTCELLELIFLASYLGRPGLHVLIPASLAAGCGMIVRYAGVALMGTGVVAILLLSRTAWRRRSRDTAIFALLSSVPMAVWLIRNILVTGVPTNRTTTFHPIGLAHLQGALDAVSSWLFFPIEPAPVRWLGFFLFLIVCGYVWIQVTFGRTRQEKLSTLTRLNLLLAIFIASYGLVIIFSLSFFDAYIPIDSRILSPLYPALLVLGIGAMNRFFALNQPGVRVRLAIGALGAIVFLSQLVGASSWLQLSYGNGIGYAGQQWRESPLADRVRRLDRSVPVFTNSPDALYAVSERPTSGIPAKVNPQTQLPNESYRAELASLRSGLQERRGVLVYFNTVRWRWYLPAEAELAQELGLHLVARVEDGAIYEAGNSASFVDSSAQRN